MADGSEKIWLSFERKFHALGIWFRAAINIFDFRNPRFCLGCRNRCPKSQVVNHPERRELHSAFALPGRSAQCLACNVRIALFATAPLSAANIHCQIFSNSARLPLIPKALTNTLVKWSCLLQRP